MKKQEANPKIMNETTTYTYRTAVEADVPQLKELGLASYGQYKNVLSEDAWGKMAANCGDENTYRNLLSVARGFVCEFERHIIGMAFLIPRGNPFAFFEKDWTYIRMVGVDPKHEGRGIGKKLTELCVQFAKESGEKTIVLHTSEFQNAARHIYESMGFKKFKTLDLIHDKQYWLYRLELGPDEHPITYHKAGPNDLVTLINLRLDFAFELNGQKNADEIAGLTKHLTEYFKKALDNNTCIFYLASHKDMAVGIGGLVLREVPGNFKNPDGNWAYLMNMYTIPSFRRKGICAKILNLLIEDANRHGIKAFELHATKEGEFVYKQNGFEMHHEPTYRKYIGL
ncbi:MAG: GNAT family N-acetyltransferase [Bacteroidota bacterium]